MTSVARAVLASLIILAGAETSAFAREPAEARTSAPSERVSLAIRSGSTSHIFRVEVARSEAEQQRGLMFRKSVGADEGMIFPFETPVRATFWMKNTLVPLDMIFIRENGTIARIAARTVPLSLVPVDAGEPVAAVLEIRGGRAAEIALSEGDMVDLKGLQRQSRVQ